jgi:hypothetical protein
MNEQAKGHLARARDYLARGEEFYRKAKSQIDAAKAKGASVQEIAKALGRSDQWVRDTLYWDGEGTLYGKDSERRERDMAKKYLAEAPLEEVERALDAMPAQRRANIATGLVAQDEVQEQIRAGGPLVSGVHLSLTDALVRDSAGRSTERGRSASKNIRDIETSRLLSDAAKLIADANAILFKHATATDDLYRCDAAMERIEQYVGRYHEIRETAPQPTA